MALLVVVGYRLPKGRLGSSFPHDNSFSPDTAVNLGTMVVIASLRGG